jgi:hypothetical protein
MLKLTPPPLSFILPTPTPEMVSAGLIFVFM